MGDSWLTQIVTQSAQLIIFDFRLPQSLSLENSYKQENLLVNPSATCDPPALEQLQQFRNIDLAR